MDVTFREAVAPDGEGVKAVSLSVDRDNPERHLYERVGFREVGPVGGSITMLLSLG